MRKVFEPTVEYVFPGLCVHCKRGMRVDEYLCLACHETAFGGSLEACAPAVGVQCLHRLGPVVRSLVHALKYRGLKGIAAYLVAAGPPLALPSGGKVAWVPVPLTGARLRERGYNQAELTARALQASLGGAVYVGILRRTKFSGSQTQLQESARRWNAAGAFSARGPAPSEVVLVDDVYTTGATTAACEAALRRAGVQSVRVVTLAWEPSKSGRADWFLDRATWG